MSGLPISVPARASRRKAGEQGVALIAEGTLEIFNDHLKFGSWRIPVSGVSNARFERRFHKRDGSWSTESNRLRFTCGGYDYKFRLHALEDLRGQLPFPFEDREVRLKTAGPAVFVIILLLLVLAYGVQGLFG